jgi:hypothetical protein
VNKIIFVESNFNIFSTYFQLTAAVNCPRQTNNAIRPRTVTNCLEEGVAKSDVQNITGHRSELTFNNYDHRSLKHKVDNADIIMNIKGSDYGVPKELLIVKKPFNCDAIIKKSGQSETAVPDRSKEALKKHWGSKRIDDVTTLCQPGGSKDLIVIVAEKTQNGLIYVEKTVENEVKRVEVEKVVVKKVDVERLEAKSNEAKRLEVERREVERREVERREIERTEADVPPIGPTDTTVSQDIYRQAVDNLLKDQENIGIVTSKFWL